MIEYKVEMFQHGQWVVARKPFGGMCYSVRKKEYALRFIENCKKDWQYVVNDKIEYLKDMPTDYRIMSREITDWKEVYNINDKKKEEG